MRLIITFEPSCDKDKLSDELFEIKDTLEFGVDATIKHNNIKKVEIMQCEKYLKND